MEHVAAIRSLMISDRIADYRIAAIRSLMISDRIADYRCTQGPTQGICLREVTGHSNCLGACSDKW